uniref:Reverse transcriptase Ty1/copia-type domain-containing protein n=1 Tax=Tanacetum cinerariifolium TaxID=118510 RepID=A0A6L2N8M9_TANCI|nr:hypothetical protein [Tanacetum cinerariifolium]
MPKNEDIVYYDHENVGAEADFNNLETSITVSPIPTTRIHNAYPISQIIGNLSSTTQTRSMARINREQGGISQILNEDFHTCMFACFLSQEEPKRVHQAFKDPSWIEAMQEELLQFKMQKVWILVDLPHEKRAIGFVDPDHPDKVYKVVKELYGLHQAPRAWYETLATYLQENGFYKGQIDQTLFIKKQKGDVKQKEDGIFINQYKYVAEILKKFRLTEGKSASTPIDTEKPLLKDPNGEDVDVHIYRSMIGSLMYLTSSRPDIMFAFWRTVAIKSLNDVIRLQVLVDKKRVVVTEAAIRDALHLDDAEGVDCLPNEEIFIELDRMGYEKPTTKLTFYKAFFSSQWKFLIYTILQSMSVKRTSWNEFSSAMASAVICLSTEEQGDEEEQGTDNAAAEEPVTAVDDVADQSSQSPTPLTPPPQQPQDIPSTSQVAQDLEILKLKTRVKKLEKANKVKTIKLKRLRKVGTSQRIESSNDTLIEDVSNQGREFNRAEDAMKETEEVREYTADTQVEGRHIYHIDMDHAAKVLIVATVSEIVSAAAVISFAVPETISAAAIPTVTTLSIKVAAPVKAAVPSTRRKRGMVIRDPEEESSAKTPSETTSKDKGKGILVEEPKPMKKKQQVELDEAYARKLQEEFNQDIDWEAEIDHVKQRAKEEPFIQIYQVMKKRPQTEAQDRRNMMMYLKNTAGFTLDYFKGMSYDDIRPIFVAKFNANMEFLLKYKEPIEEEESRAIVTINETPAQKAAKRRKLIKEAKEAESIKQYLQIVPDEDDDVFTEATPLARKVPVVDYQVILVNNKPRYKIIKADDTHQLYASFITMLKFFDREDLETLWRIVKERFSTSKPNNFSDEYLLTALKTLFKRPDGQDNVWRNQNTVHGQALVKSWKLLTSCGVHIISFNTTQIILLVERRYPLMKFTLEQMLNVLRLQVEEDSEMSLELIRFTRQQLQELKIRSSKGPSNWLMGTPVDFLAFIMDRLKVDTLTLELLDRPTYELMKGSCKSLVELEFFLEEVYKATTDHRKYTTSVTKTKAADYGHIKWIEDLVPRTMWSQEPVSYDKHVLWGISHWGRKRQQFYGFAVNKESARDVYSKRRIITVTELKIVEWHNYKHLDWITMRRDDEKLYKFKEGDFKRLCIQDIEDIMFTRSIVIQRHMEDRQLGVESYQKKLNLTKPDTYRFDLKRKEAYTAYSNLRGFIYQNKDKQNRLMWIDELHKFSGGTLNDVRTTLDDRLKGIRIKYLPHTIWRKSDKERAAAMIQAIDKQLKTRRIMRSLEKFFGGRLYEGDFRMLQRTI